MKKLALIPALLFALVMTMGASMAFYYFDASQITSGTLPVARLDLSAPPAIGGTTPAAGTFTTATTTGAVVPGTYVQGVNSSKLATLSFVASSSANITTKKPVLFVAVPSAANTFIDYSGYGNAVTAVGTPAVAAYLGNGFSLTMNGTSQYWTVPDRDEFSFTNGSGTDAAFSITAVVYVSSTGTRVIVSKYDNTTAAKHMEYVFDLEAKKLTMNLDNETNTKTSVRQSDAAIATGYHHVGVVKAAGTADAGANMTLFVDGALIASTGAGSSGYPGMTNTATDVWVGAQKGAAGTPEGYNDGPIPMVAIWNSVLTTTEVFVDYQRSRSLWGI